MVIVVMGVTGSGKTTVGRALAEAVGADFHDADDDHPPQNVAKMARGVPLTDADRAPWLDVLRGRIDRRRTAPGHYVLACSALTRKIRERLGLARDGIRVVHLAGGRALLDARMRARDHFMSPELLVSQLELLEPPDDAVVLDARRPVAELVDEVRRALAI